MLNYSRLRGCIRREPWPGDRRGALAVLTDAGQAALRAAAPGHVEGVRRRLFDPLTAEQLTQLREISQAILRRLGEPTRASLAGPDRDG